MSKRKREEHIRAIAEILQEVLGEDELPVDENTRLVEDLGVQSLEFLAVLRSLQEEFGLPVFDDTQLGDADWDWLAVLTAGDIAEWLMEAPGLHASTRSSSG